MAGSIKEQERGSCLSKPLAAENFLPSAPSLVGPTRLFIPSFLLEYGEGLTTQHLQCLSLFTRLWRIWERRSPITCSSFIVCIVVVLETTAWWSGGAVFRGYTNRKQRCLSTLYTDVAPSYTLAVNAELRQKSLAQFQAILSLLLGRLWTVAIMENARFKCFCHDSSCVFREGWNEVKKLPEPCPLVLLLIERCFWWFRENKFWRFSMWITLLLLLHAYIWHDCVCVYCMLWGCFMFSKHGIHQISLYLNFFFTSVISCWHIFALGIPSFQTGNVLSAHTMGLFQGKAAHQGKSFI